MESTYLVGFEDALKGIKKGFKFAREGWNGNGMWIVLVSPVAPEHTEAFGITNPSGFHSFINYSDGEVEMVGEKGFYATLPFIAMKTADEKIVPWLASQTDLLAEDWYREE